MFLFGEDMFKTGEIYLLLMQLLTFL
jgi:hypothetical protein